MMIIPILMAGIVAGSISALWFGLTSGSWLIALAAYSATGVGVCILSSAVLVARCHYLCNSERRREATTSKRSVAA